MSKQHTDEGWGGGFRRFLQLLDEKWLSILLRVGIRAYQLTLGVLFRGSCRYTPSCSRYGDEAIRKYGAVRGAAMTMKRLARCHPFHPGGVDPVP